MAHRDILAVSARTQSLAVEASYLTPNGERLCLWNQVEATSARPYGRSVPGLIFVKIPVVVAEVPTFVADVAAVVPDPLPVVMDLAPVLMDLIPLHLRAGLVTAADVAPLELAMMPKITSVMMKSPLILPQVTTILTKVLPVFPTLAHVLMDILTVLVLQGVAGGLRKARRRDAGRSQRS